MAGLVQRSFDSPDEVRSFEAGTGDLKLVNLENGPVGRATFQPGWKWSEHVKPIAKTDSCQAAHMGYFVSGRMKIVMDDGEQAEFGPGDFMICPRGTTPGLSATTPASSSTGRAWPTTPNAPDPTNLHDISQRPLGRKRHGC
jgi:quercetin dioxygenase-like cupin family protein